MDILVEEIAQYALNHSLKNNLTFIKKPHLSSENVLE